MINYYFLFKQIQFTYLVKDISSKDREYIMYKHLITLKVFRDTFNIVILSPSEGLYFHNNYIKDTIKE